MHHDLVAELQAYRNEMTRPRDDQHAADVRKEIDRVAAAIAQKAEALETRAASHLADGQDVPAAHLQVEARELREAIRDAAETAQASTPLERAVPKKAGK